jgi:hypothetical protein
MGDMGSTAPHLKIEMWGIPALSVVFPLLSATVFSALAGWACDQMWTER